MKEIKIGQRIVGDGHPCFIAAEIGSNHGQKLERAKEMIRIAAECRVDAVKFQSINYQEMVAVDDAQAKDLFEQIKLDHEWYADLKIVADLEGIIFFSAPCYLGSIEIMEAIDVELYKIASPQTHNFPQLIRAAARTGKPLVISTGYCDFERITRAVELCKEVGNEQYILLQCTSQYPARPEDINLAVIDALKQQFKCPAGLSDHSLEFHIAVGAVARGANFIEKHFTLDRSLSGPDQPFAIEPSELRSMVKQIRDIEVAIGTGVKRVLPLEQALIEDYQLIYRLVTKQPLKKGSILSDESLLFKRAPSGIPAEEESKWLGKRLVRDVPVNQVLHWHDVEGYEEKN